jgi:peptidoglycan/LPS O-acetylase OafA/YrhL
VGLFRVILAISVVLSHIVKTETPFYQGFGGTNSVEIFFLISGFYIALILDKTYKSKRMFYLNRILRLYPIYLIVCLLVLLTSILRRGFAENLFGYSPLVLLISTFSNLTLIGTDWLMFFDTSNGGIQLTSSVVTGDRMRDLLWIAPAWSLGIEITFYAMAPILCRWRSRFLIATIIGLCTIRILFNQSEFNFAESPFDARFFPFELPYFLVGILLYRCKRDAKLVITIPLKYLYSALFLFFLIFEPIRSGFDLSRTASMAVLVIVAAVVVLFGQSSEFDRKFGELSYPIYISHVFIAQVYEYSSTGIVKKFSLLDNSHISMSVQVLLIVLVSYFLLQITKPIEKIRDKNRNLN